MFIMATILHFGKSGLPTKVGVSANMADIIRSDITCFFRSFHRTMGRSCSSQYV